jgi:hypothetical protein
VLDVVRLVALGLGIVRGLRTKSAASVACRMLLAYGSVVVALEVARAVVEKKVTGEYAFGMAFLGTTAPVVEGIAQLPCEFGLQPTTSVASSHLRRWPSRRSLTRIGGSSRLRPESVEARRWDALGAPFLLLAVIDMTLAIVAALMEWVLRSA